MGQDEDIKAIDDCLRTERYVKFDLGINGQYCRLLLPGRTKGLTCNHLSDEIVNILIGTSVYSKQPFPYYRCNRYDSRKES